MLPRVIGAGLYGILISACVSCFIQDQTTFGLIIKARLYRTRFFGHKFELSGLLHSGFLPGDTCVVRTA
jgi:hypothetical protein